MALDERQIKIEEGAGLTESRLNTEFVDFLKKYSTPILLVICVVALGYVAYDRYRKGREQTLDTAWSELEEQLSKSRSPDALLKIADENATEAGIPLLARTEAADILLQAALAGVRPGTEFKPDGSADADDLLTADQKNQMLERASQEYQKVIALAGSDENKVYHHIKALFGLAAIAETKGNFDAAKTSYDEVIRIAKGADLKIAEVAQKLLDSMDEAKTAPRLFADSTIVTRPPPPPPPAAAAPTAVPMGTTPPLITAPPVEVNPVPPSATPDPKPATPTPAPAPAEGEKPKGV